MRFAWGPRPLSVMVPAMIVGAVVAGCGSSVADADAPRPTRDRTAPFSPFCTAVDANSAALRPLAGLAVRGSLPPQELTVAVDALRRTGADLVNAAPGDVRADAERVVASVNVQLDALVANGGDASAAGREPGVAAQRDSTDLVAANQRLSAYVSDNC